MLLFSASPVIVKNPRADKLAVTAIITRRSNASTTATAGAAATGDPSALREFDFIRVDDRLNHRISRPSKKLRTDARVCVRALESITLQTTHPRQDVRTFGKAGDRPLKRYIGRWNKPQGTRVHATANRAFSVE
jgi:hypothetical protein